MKDEGAVALNEVRLANELNERIKWARLDFFVMVITWVFILQLPLGHQPRVSYHIKTQPR